jgi:hypothetical protein
VIISTKDLRICGTNFKNVVANPVDVGRPAFDHGIREALHEAKLLYTGYPIFI